MKPLGDFVVVFHRDIYRQHGPIKRPNYLMAEAANSLSAAAGPELSKTTRKIESYRQSSFGLGYSKAAHLGSGLRAVAPRCLGRENAGKTMTVLHHALRGG